VTCDAFLDRLYDDDARAAERGQATVPPDMAAHLLVCEACRSVYDAAGADELLLTRALLDSPPQAWRAEVLRQIAKSPRAAWTQRIATVNGVVTWGILAMAASTVLSGQSSTAEYVAAFLTGGVAALLPASLGRQWMALLRRPFRWV
jgi:predicted anti-sigma-YlaC factor YlaD